MRTTCLAKLIPRTVRSHFRKASGKPIFVPEDEHDSPRTISPLVQKPFTRSKKEKAETTLLSSTREKRSRSSVASNAASPLHPIDSRHRHESPPTEALGHMI
ncbi:hypothetical protein HAX54_041633 [Datura stramonium]|uniref:Uncharacterized protein n=1 Tax=Datura stramonium TaxID=4076 RepID=A0ABS8VXH0_DATST|nr:hypothetical protein [Datura stramonium]